MFRGLEPLTRRVSPLANRFRPFESGREIWMDSNKDPSSFGHTWVLGTVMTILWSESAVG